MLPIPGKTWQLTAQAVNLLETDTTIRDNWKANSINSIISDLIDNQKGYSVDLYWSIILRGVL